MVICSLDALKKVLNETKIKKEIVEVLEQPTITFIIFGDFLMFYKIFLSPQVKRWAFITCKHRIYELPHELPNDLRLTILGN